MVLPRLDSDIYALFDAVLEGKDFDIAWKPEMALGVVLAAKGYPGKYPKGAEIKGLDKAKGLVFHMGTARKDDSIVTAGGRVLMVTGMAPTLDEARAKALADIEDIECPLLFHRNDIGHQAF